MLTCYDASFARVLDESGVDIVLVGDSLANVVLGLDETRDVSFDEMYNHAKAVRGSVKNSLLIVDMPYVSYQKNIESSVIFAKKFIEEVGADGVKIEWFNRCPQVLEKLANAKIPVMGHIGLTPQTADELGGYKVQGKDAKRSLELIEQAQVFDKLGAFSLVIECVPEKVSKLITERIKIPTIGIGAGPNCDGQVLVLYDMLGLYKNKKLKFVKAYADLYSSILKASKTFIDEVKGAQFPSTAESFSIDDNEFNILLNEFKTKDES